MSVSNGNSVKVIRAKYEKTDFLINRTQSSSSIFASGMQSIASPYRYVKSLIEVDKNFYLLFDLDRYFSERFRVERIGTAQLAVISSLELFSEKTGRFLRNDFIPKFPYIEEKPADGSTEEAELTKEANLTERAENQKRPDTEHVAFLIASNAAVKEMKLRDFAPHPSRLRNHLMERGVMASGFTDRGVVFLIDLERLIDSKELLYVEENE